MLKEFVWAIRMLKAFRRAAGSSGTLHPPEPDLVLLLPSPHNTLLPCSTWAWTSKVWEKSGVGAQLTELLKRQEKKSRLDAAAAGFHCCVSALWELYSKQQSVVLICCLTALIYGHCRVTRDTVNFSFAPIHDSFVSISRINSLKWNILKKSHCTCY